MCCWVTLPEDGCFDDLYWAALRSGVAYTPGEVFLTGRHDRSALRLAFGKLPPRKLQEAVGILGELIAERLGTRKKEREPVCCCGPLV